MQGSEMSIGLMIAALVAVAFVSGWFFYWFGRLTELEIRRKHLEEQLKAPR